MAIHVHVPVISIESESLRRNLALRDLIVAAVVMPDPQTPTLQSGGSSGTEMHRIRRAALRLKDADALLDLFPRVIALPGQRAQARHEGQYLRPEQSGLQSLECPECRKERVNFGRRKPQTRKLIPRSRSLFAEAVAVARAVVFDGRVEAIPHVCQIAL